MDTEHTRYEMPDKIGAFINQNKTINALSQDSTLDSQLSKKQILGRLNRVEQMFYSALKELQTLKKLI